jgi:hypothetical protein
LLSSLFFPPLLWPSFSDHTLFILTATLRPSLYHNYVLVLLFRLDYLCVCVGGKGSRGEKKPGKGTAGAFGTLSRFCVSLGPFVERSAPRVVFCIIIIIIAGWLAGWLSLPLPVLPARRHEGKKKKKGHGPSVTVVTGWLAVPSDGYHHSTPTLLSN